MNVGYGRVSNRGWRYKIRGRPLSIILSFVTISLIVYFIARMAVPQLRCIPLHSIVSAAPQLYPQTFQHWIYHLSQYHSSGLEPYGIKYL